MDERRVRISDIAEELGVSTATVSNVIHGKTNKLSDETVRRVQALLEERQYIPSMAGILLAQNSSRIIGVFVNDHEKYEGHVLSDAFIASSLDHLSAEIERGGQFMMVKRAKDAREVLQFASMWNMEGLVMLGFCLQDYQFLRSRMRIPFVVYDGACDHPARIADITIDDFDGGRQVGAHFRRLGHTRALCIADNDDGVDAARRAGFQAGFGAGAGFLRVPLHARERLAFYDAELARFRAVTAVFAVSDVYALELMGFLQERGFAIPRDLSLAGFDDTPLCTLARPTLTTVRQDGALRARVALEKLRALRAGTDAGGTVTLPVTLIARASSAQIGGDRGLTIRRENDRID